MPFVEINCIVVVIESVVVDVVERGIDLWRGDRNIVVEGMHIIVDRMILVWNLGYRDVEL